MDKVFKSSTTLLLLVLIVSVAGPPAVRACIPGDLDENCLVDLKDLMVFTQQWLDTGGCSDPNCADLDDDSNVDIADFAILADNYRKRINPVVINEIHTDPDLKTEQVEFVELYNISNETVDLSGWYFSRGFDFTFPPSTSIPPHGYIVIVENTNVFDQNSPNDTDFQAKFGFEPNGIFIGKLSNDGENIELRNAEGEEMDQVDYQLGFPWPTVGDPVPFAYEPDGNGHSMQLANPCLDNDLGGSWRSGSPTPGAKNTPVYSENIPPQIRQVNHDPEEPTSSDTVTITCKATDPDGVASVTLRYQLLNPGSYIPITLPNYSAVESPIVNTAYENPANWSSAITMYDNGAGADQTAGDDIYTAQISASTNRSLVRYRITVEDNDACSVTVPYSDDPVPNFAYFIYDGVPSWSGARNPSGSPPDNVVVTYGTDVLTSLPVYHFISRNSDVEDCTWNYTYGLSSSHRKDFKWAGTLVYDGQVYDHITYRARGGTHRYDSGKNMWKFDFKRGHYLRARDDYGRWHDVKWDKLNLSSTIQNPGFEIHGKQGMFEGIGYKLFNLVGVPGPKTHWIHLRIIDGATESGPTQYDGDFWGLYLVVEQMDGRFLDEHELLDGNLYKMDTNADNGYSDRNNLGPMGPDDYSDVSTFVNTYKTSPATSWWTANVDVNSYFSYRTVVEALHHYDIGSGKNYFYYADPVTDVWEMLPWDLDLTFDDDTWDCFNNGESPFKKYGLWADTNLEIERNNRIREILDLLFNYEQENQLIDEYAVIIDEPNDGGLSFVYADVALWDYHPQNNYQGDFFQTVKYTGDFNGVIDRMKNFIRHRVVEGDPNEGTKEPGLSEICDDPAIPNTPTITFVGNPNYPTNNLRFQTSAFSGSGSFAAVKWRIGQVEEGSQIPGGVELDLVSEGSSWKYYKGETSAPPKQAGNTYWQEFSYNDTSWSSGPAPLGWGEDPCFLGTELTGMQYAHSSFYLRKKFTVDDLAAMDSVRLKAMYDDGFNVWINDNWLVSKNMSGESVPYNGYATAANPDEKDWFAFSLPDPSGYLVEGVNANVLAIQVQNMEYEETGGDPVVNGSFEFDSYGNNITCHHGSDMLGWSVTGSFVGVDAECGKPGVCSGDCRAPVAPDGNCYAFMQSNDTYLYQTTAHSIVEGKDYTLYFDASLPWNASTDIVASLYYVDDGNQFEIDSNTISLPSYGGWSYDESVPFTAGAGQAYLGKKLGVKFYAPNLGDSNKWILMDDVRLQASPPFVPVLDPDCFIDIRLVADTLDPCTTPPNYLTRPGKYEIEALWESGEINPFQSDINIPASVVRPNRTYRVRCRHKDTTSRWSHWSDPNQFLTGDSLSAGIVADLRITELMYNPADGNGYNNDDFEFIELKNTGVTTLDLTYVSFIDGVTFDFNDSNVSSLAPGAFALVVSDQNAFKSRYGASFNIAGEYIGNLANGGETVELVDFWNGTIAEFGYNDGRGWPLAADGAGHSLVPLNSAIPGEPFNSLEYGGNWRMSTYMHGSPGADDPTVATTVVLNEIMAHTDYNSPPYDSNDWIELYNTTGSTVNLTSDWYLSDEGNTIANLKKWAIPSTSIGANGKVTFDEVNDFHNPYPAGFGIDKSGEQIYLSYLPGNSNDRIVDSIRFKGQENNVSLGRYPNGDQFWFHMPTSRGSDNSMPNQCAVVINEIMYHPVDPNDEYIELYNPTGATVNLWNTEDTWRVRGIGNNDYYFPPSTSISSGGSIILVGFDPTVTFDRQAFENAYDTGTLVPNADIFGPWDGNLSNASERFALEKPQAADPPDVEISWVIVDEVMYGDYSPWPETPDGEGDALHRISDAADESGNDPANWQEGSPSPGS
ncbi:MAG: lamin tail domain-containing protein [Planctomycetota bacterium]|nr:MAG: lamin tail domain-containing protein [Planctomycetota bacterium]